MKTINSININEAPLGMMIKNNRNNKMYFVDLDSNGEKSWKLCRCYICSLNQTKKFPKEWPRPRSFSGGSLETNLAPSPEEHSWHHHHAPFYQVFNNYVCIKKDTLEDMRNLLMEIFKPKQF
jgi:hypothetical protein